MQSPDVSSITLRQLQYVVEVARLGGFRRAAQACHVSQPALSAQVALVERQLGVQVFERDRRSVRLSSAGARIVEQAQRVLVAAADLRELARQLADPFSGWLRLGVIPTIGPYLLPEITPPLARAFPKLSLVWSEARTDDLVSALRSGTLDAALLAVEADIGDLEFARLGRDPFVLAAAPGHPAVRPRGPATAEALNGTSVLLLDDGHCFRDQALQVCAQARVDEQSFRATSLATLVQMVSTGNSVTLLPTIALTVENRRSQLRVRRFVAPGPGRTLALAWRRGTAMTRTLDAVADAIRPAVKQHLQSVTVTG
jgi:LysR family transcriptional regulator, hydrogen peroxide-inducible genes activator